MCVCLHARVCVFARLPVRVRTCFPHFPVQPPPSPSGANYTGEIVEWLGFAIAAGTLPAAAFALYDPHSSSVF